MLAKIIELSARNKFLVFLLVGFLTVWGIWAVYHTPLDAIPDLSDVQVIVFTEWPGRSPDLVEDQITYPIVSSLLAAPKVRAVRGKSFLGLSFVYAIFEDGTDIYWARSRVLEYLQGVSGKLPAGVTPLLGPDATGVGWGFQYALVDETGKHDLAQLRSLQDWTLKYALESVPGVSEVASVGGFVKQYQVTVDPNRLKAYDLGVRYSQGPVLASPAVWKNDFSNRIERVLDDNLLLRVDHEPDIGELRAPLGVEVHGRIRPPIVRQGNLTRQRRAFLEQVWRDAASQCSVDELAGWYLDYFARKPPSEEAFRVSYCVVFSPQPELNWPDRAALLAAAASDVADSLPRLKNSSPYRGASFWSSGKTRFTASSNGLTLVNWEPICMSIPITSMPGRVAARLYSSMARSMVMPNLAFFNPVVM